ncbi:hypothetical protein [Sinomonas sp. ASV322]|uniref:hypothetical protein n=1 Tax=Sinomonas sp. ASV322 TaxID=3041920 RepID=UPI0027DB1E2D|nr:hypothetical protein [Sinomonas sp. ASV322]MDQ4502711.1 hypothetical protein [Sinomonas sp. ASV322]
MADNTAPDKSADDSQDLEYSPSARGRGVGRIIVAIYGIFALSASARAGYQILTKFSEAPLAYILSAVAAVVYIVATVAMARRGVPGWYVTLSAVLVELVGVLVVGTISVVAPQDFAQDTVWSVYGRGYGFVPLVLPFIGLAWLYTNRPRRVGRPSRR